MAHTWHGRKVKFRKGSISNLRQEIPYFRRDPFRIEGGGENQHLDIIVREPLKGNQDYLLPQDDEVHIPIATVSRQYSLVQHHDVLDALEEALEHTDFDSKCLEAELTLTEYGERMWINFTLPTSGFNLDVDTYGFSPDDGYPVVLKVNALNSVDKTTALEINLTWHRLVCGNGLIYGEDVDFRKIHLNKSLNSGAIKEFLATQLQPERFSKQRERAKKWYTTKVVTKKLSEEKPSPGQIEYWIDEIVEKRWGAHAAARAYHIAKTGEDGNVGPQENVKPLAKTGEDGNVGPGLKNIKPHERRVKPTVKVPGSYAPVRNAYDISQVLSWLAGQRGTIQEQLKWMMDIPYLMEALLRTEEPLTLQIE